MPAITVLAIILVAAGEPTLPQLVLGATIGARHWACGAPHIVVYVVYDNNPYKPGLETGWGLSLYIEAYGARILFDTGGDGEKLVGNMRSLGISPRSIDYIVISHIHSDHTGGLIRIVSENPGVTVYIPSSFPESFRERLESLGARVVDVKKPVQVAPGVMSTGEICGGGVCEQSLIVSTPWGPAVFTGCAHPGLERIVGVAERITGKRLLLLGGGFHLIGLDSGEIRRIAVDLREMHGVEYVMPIHCSGDLARRVFREVYGQRCILAGVGYMLNLSSLAAEELQPPSTTPTSTQLQNTSSLQQYMTVGALATAVALAATIACLVSRRARRP